MAVNRNYKRGNVHFVLSRIPTLKRSRDTLTDKLTTSELLLLEGDIKALIEKEQYRAFQYATEMISASFFRVLKDRFGFGKKRLHLMWDLASDYMDDLGSGLITNAEMLSILKREGIVFKWEIDKLLKEAKNENSDQS